MFIEEIMNLCRDGKCGDVVRLIEGNDFLRSIQLLYEEGRFFEAMEKISGRYPDRDEPADIRMVKSWCLYRRKEYEEAKKQALQAGGIEAEELLAQLAAYVDKDDATLTEIHQNHPDNPSVCNGLAIRARDSDSNISTKLLIEAVARMMNKKGIAAIHFINNAARTLLAKGNGSTDIIIAIGLWQTALLKYGYENYHHRAAVCFWISSAYEQLGEMALAMKFAMESLALWEEQLNREPDNPSFIERRSGANDRVETLRTLSKK
ncbi:MAG: hypothetical protein PHR47_02770 [Candidatus Pacebacteria bacterium]|nr:hypothetical protein [Candidatus Paceibacterota bacterium]